MKNLCLICCLTLTIAQVNSQDLVSDWKTTSGTIEKREHLGRTALFLSKGLAWLPASKFANGVIEADVATSLMGGLNFRGDSNHNYEEVYLRIPKSGGPDALQFGSVFNGEFSWQFYPEYQANVVYPANQWVHMKIVVEGDKAGIYMLNRDTAVLLIDSLRTGNQSGHVGIWTLNGAYFSNIRFRAATPEERLPAIPKKLIYNKEAVTGWWISQPSLFTGAPPDILPASSLSSLKFQPAATDPDGYLNINRFAKKQIWGRSRENSNDMVWIRYEWDESTDRLKAFSFDFSNMCFMYCNGKKVFAGNNSFLLKGPLYRGDIDKQLRANTVFLPVTKGKNALLIAVSGTNNGWGFMGQFADGTVKKFTVN